MRLIDEVEYDQIKRGIVPPRLKGLTEKIIKECGRTIASLPKAAQATAVARLLERAVFRLHNQRIEHKAIAKKSAGKKARARKLKKKARK